MMSEYQFYEFQALDRPLDEIAITALRRISSRARITTTSLVNVYHFGDFKGNPEQLLEKYFDAFLYVSNWGTRQLMFKFPKSLFESASAKPYCKSSILELKSTPQHEILEFRSDNEDGGDDFEEGDDWLASLIALRFDILSGDNRSLYLAWLAGAQDLNDAEERTEPPVPPGLQDLTASLSRLADFFRLDADLLEAASENSASIKPNSPSPQRLKDWIGLLSESKKNDCLFQIMQGETTAVISQLQKRFREDETRALAPPLVLPVAQRRTIRDLLATRDKLANDKKKRAAENRAKEKEKLAREESLKRSRYLDSLVGQEKQLWKQVQVLASLKKSKEYDSAVALLTDLRDLSKLSHGAMPFAANLETFRLQHSSKRALISRLAKADLTK